MSKVLSGLHQSRRKQRLRVSDVWNVFDAQSLRGQVDEDTCIVLAMTLTNRNGRSVLIGNPVD